MSDRKSYDTLEFRWDEFITSLNILIIGLLGSILVWTSKTIAGRGDALEHANNHLAYAMLEMTFFICPLVILVNCFCVISNYYGYWSLTRENKGRSLF